MLYRRALACIEQLEAQVNSLQNKWANRELSQQDSDALMAENAKLQAVVDAANHLLSGYDQEAVYHLEKALAALENRE
jgi:histidyl-tRNA synthetase